MNLVLFEPGETAGPLPAGDPRARHILEVLRRQPGESFDCGLIDGPRGKATVVAIRPEGLDLEFRWGDPPPPLEPITLVVGLPRPQIARRILHEAATLGIARMEFVATARGDPNYAASTLWSSGEWRRHLIDGAQQAFDTRLPAVAWGRPLAAALADAAAAPLRLALDHYEARASLAEACRGSALPAGQPFVLALGPERGWDATDRERLRAHGFTLVHLGPRVLRTDTAVLAAIVAARTALGRL